MHFLLEILEIQPPECTLVILSQKHESSRFYGPWDVIDEMKTSFDQYSCTPSQPKNNNQSENRGCRGNGANGIPLKIPYSIKLSSKTILSLDQRRRTCGYVITRCIVWSTWTCLLLQGHPSGMNSITVADWSTLIFPHYSGSFSGSLTPHDKLINI